MTYFIEIGHLVLVSLILFIPTTLIYRKAGFHPIWAALLLLPGLGLLLICLQLALLPWPNHRDHKER